MRFIISLCGILGIHANIPVIINPLPPSDLQEMVDF